MGASFCFICEDKQRRNLKAPSRKFLKSVKIKNLKTTVCSVCEVRKKIFPGRSVWGAHIIRTTHFASWWSNCRVFKNNQPFPRWCYTAAHSPCQPCPLRNHPLNESLRFVEFNNETSCASASAAGASRDSEWALRHGWCASQRRRWVTGPKEKRKGKRRPCALCFLSVGHGMVCCAYVCEGFTSLHNYKRLILRLWSIQRRRNGFSQNQT